MPFEVITCPLSACFLGMSSTQADVARSLRLSDARDPQFDRDDARAAYAVLAGVMLRNRRANKDDETGNQGGDL